MKNIFFLFFLFIVEVFFATCSDKQLETKEEVNNLNDSTQYYFYRSLDTALIYSDRALAHFKEDTTGTDYLRALNNRAYIYFNKSLFDSVEVYINSVKNCLDGEKDIKKYKAEFWYYNIIQMRMDMRKTEFHIAYNNTYNNLNDFYKEKIEKTKAEYFLKTEYTIGEASLYYYYNNANTFNNSIKEKLENFFDAYYLLLLVKDEKNDSINKPMKLYRDYVSNCIYMGIYDLISNPTSDTIDIKAVIKEEKYGGKLDYLLNELNLNGDSVFIKDNRKKLLNYYLTEAFKYIDVNIIDAKRYTYFSAQYTQALADIFLDVDTIKYYPIIENSMNLGDYKKHDALSLSMIADSLYRAWSGSVIDNFQIMANDFRIGKCFLQKKDFSSEDRIQAIKYFQKADSLLKNSLQTNSYNHIWEFRILRQLNQLDSAAYNMPFRISEFYNDEIIKAQKKLIDDIVKEKDSEKKKNNYTLALIIFCFILIGVCFVVYHIFKIQEAKENEKQIIKTFHNLVNINKKGKDTDDFQMKDLNTGKYYHLLKTSIKEIYTNNKLFYNTLDSFSLVLFVLDDKDSNKINKEIIRTDINKESGYDYQLDTNLTVNDIKYPGILLLYACSIAENKKDISDTIIKHFDDFIFNGFNKNEYKNNLRNLYHEVYEDKNLSLLGKKFKDFDFNWAPSELNSKSLIYMPLKNIFTGELIGVLSFQSEVENLFVGKEKTRYRQIFELIKDLIEKNIVEYDFEKARKEIEDSKNENKELEQERAELETKIQELETKDISCLILDKDNELLEAINDLPDRVYQLLEEKMDLKKTVTSKEQNDAFNDLKDKIAYMEQYYDDIEKGRRKENREETNKKNEEIEKKIWALWQNYSEKFDELKIQTSKDKRRVAMIMCAGKFSNKYIEHYTSCEISNAGDIKYDFRKKLESIKNKNELLERLYNNIKT